MARLATAKRRDRRTVRGPRKEASSTEATLQQQAEQYLGTAIDPLEWDGAKAYAEHKLKRIIDREGDADGARREPWYLAQLIAETVRGNRFSRLTKLVYELTEQFGVKKEQPTSENVSRPKTNTPIIAQETSECNRRI